MGAINISNVGKIYPNGTRALEDVNIEINDGYLKTLRKIFFTHCDVSNINLLTASLYFTLLPLHEYDEDKFDRYKNIIEDLM